jgi:hypothetical protein
MSLLALVLAAAPLTTLAEQSDWAKTGRFDEVERLCVEFPKRYPGKVKCERFGTTPLGRPMLALIASADGTFSPEAAKKKQRPVVLFQGGIHAGEIDGKDAGFWLLREVLDGKTAKGALSKVTVVFVPVFNVDGHERFSKNQRPNQRGPEEMGWRVTSQNLNLNRDYMKADAPEMIAMLGLLHRFEPILYADLHVTDGAKFQHDVSVTVEPQRVGPASLQSWGRTLEATLKDTLAAQGHLPLFFYPDFDDTDDPQSGFSHGWAPPRFANAYWVLNRRFGILVETHSWKPYPARVKATFDVCSVLLEQAALHATEWEAAAKLADEAASKRAGTDVTLLVTTTKEAHPIDFLGYEYTRTKSDVSGKFWVRSDETKPVVLKLGLRADLTPSLTLKAPAAGYVISATAAPLVAPRLTAHGVRFTTLKKGTSLDVEQFKAVAPTFRDGSYEGRLTVTFKGNWSPSTEFFAPGSLFVPIAQPQAELVMHLLEPTATDSFAAWGFFNAHLEQKEWLEDYLTEEFARERLKEPAVKAAFDEKLKDAEFAKSPTARLAFFSSQHPSADVRWGVLPVFRVALSPPASN